MIETTATLNGQLAVVTGASSGLGEATAIALARAGANVALLARTAADLERVAVVLKSHGRAASGFPCDLGDPHSIEQVIDDVRAELGPVRVLVNAAATDVPAPVSELSLEGWERVQAVNLRAVFLLCKHVLPDMAEAGQGTIVNVSSVAGKRGWANASAYCASKFALTGFTQALAAEAKADGVRVCLVYPGAMATHWGTWSAEDREADTNAARDPREALSPDAVADLIAWIATTPREVVVNEAIVSPLEERGWP